MIQNLPISKTSRRLSLDCIRNSNQPRLTPVNLRVGRNGPPQTIQEGLPPEQFRKRILATIDGHCNGFMHVGPLQANRRQVNTAPGWVTNADHNLSNTEE